MDSIVFLYHQRLWTYGKILDKIVRQGGVRFFVQFDIPLRYFHLNIWNGNIGVNPLLESIYWIQFIGIQFFGVFL